MTTIHHGQGPDLPGCEQFSPAFQQFADCTPTAHAPSVEACPRTRVLLVNGAPRSDGSWTGTAAKTWRLTDLARQTLEADGIGTEVLDLGLLPACGDLRDWSAAIRAKCAAAHGILVLTPSNWLPTHAMLHAVFEGDSGHLSDRAYGIVVHGDCAGVADARTALAEQLDRLGMVDSDSFGPLTCYAGYCDAELQAGQAGADTGADADWDEQARNVARALHKAVTELRAGRLAVPVNTAPAPPYHGIERRAKN